MDYLLKTIQVVKELRKNSGIDFPEFVILYDLYHGYENYKELHYDKSNVINNLLLYNYITKEYNITSKGVNLVSKYIDITTPLDTSSTSLIKKVENTFEDKFDELWNTYPVNDKHSHFPRTRYLRNDKKRAKKLYKEILNENVYAHEDIIWSINEEVNIRINSSINKNNLTFMKNLCTWLHQRDFETIIDSKEEESKEIIINYGSSVE